jgi:hypothetical protein
MWMKGQKGNEEAEEGENRVDLLTPRAAQSQRANFSTISPHQQQRPRAAEPDLDAPTAP